MTSPLVGLAAAWIAWCALHSALIAPGVRHAARRVLGRADRAYRLAYNLLSALTLAPLLLWTRALGGPTVFDWWGAWVPVSLVLLAASGALFWYGAGSYDLRTFVGLRQLREGGRRTGLTASGRLSRAGALGFIRHPWYSAGILFLAAGSKTGASATAALILGGYLMAGAFLEERRLIGEFGDDYRAYRREVSMFVPMKWLRKRLKGGTGG